MNFQISLMRDGTLRIPQTMRKMLRNRLRRIFAILYIAVMACSMLPGTIAAAKGQDDNPNSNLSYALKAVMVKRINPDSYGNRTSGKNKKRRQTFVYKNGNSVIKNVSISMKASGNIKKTSSIENIMGIDIMCSDVVGLVGDPFFIKTDSKFNKAVISFKIDRSKLGDTKFVDLLFLWYDEENYEFVELETIYDKKKSTVSVETTHPGKYMVVDKYKWFEAWGIILK